jgi:hypothetical protein
LNEDLQESVYAYLEERGISAELPEKLAMLAQAKEQQEYTHWLARMEEFLLYDPTKKAKPLVTDSRSGASKVCMDSTHTRTSAYSFHVTEL